MNDNQPTNQPTSASPPEPAIAPDAAELEMARLTRRAFLVGGLATVAGAAGLTWLNGARPHGWPFPVAPTRDGLPAPLRRAHEINQAISQATFHDSANVPTFPATRSAMPKVNGMAGLQDIESDNDATPTREEWQLRITGVPNIPAALAAMRAVAGEAAARPDPSDSTAILATFQLLARLPKVEQVVEMKCVEGWSQVVHWGGASLAGFIRLCFPQLPDEWRRVLNQGTLPRYLSTTTPDQEYYVGLDIESAMHPQSLLCYEMQGAPLQPAHGAPVRVVMPMKYGYKSLKRLGSIAFASQRSPDYWAERGYDWYAGH